MTASTNQTQPAIKRRQSSFDEEAVKKLEKQLQQRPEKSELVDRNILKGVFSDNFRLLVKQW